MDLKKMIPDSDLANLDPTPNLGGIWIQSRSNEVKNVEKVVFWQGHVKMDPKKNDSRLRPGKLRPQDQI